MAEIFPKEDVVVDDILITLLFLLLMDLPQKHLLQPRAGRIPSLRAPDISRIRPQPRNPARRGRQRNEQLHTQPALPRSRHIWLEDLPAHTPSQKHHFPREGVLVDDLPRRQRRLLAPGGDAEVGMARGHNHLCC